MHALFPASFDPVTNGHMDILTRAAGVFDSVVAGVFANERDDTLFHGGRASGAAGDGPGSPTERSSAHVLRA